MINDFINTCSLNATKKALIIYQKSFSFDQLLKDVFKMSHLLEKKLGSSGEPVLIFVMPCYELYVLLLACIIKGVRVVLLDSYGNKKRNKALLEKEHIRKMLVNNHSKIFARLLLPKMDYINIKNYRCFDDSKPQFIEDETKIILTTFTSGTTSLPKPIFRSIGDLMNQFELVKNNITLETDDVVFCTLPIYVLLVLFQGMTCIYDHKIYYRNLKKHHCTAILTNISKALSIRKKYDFVNNVFFGGSYIYQREAERLIESFPNAKITYVYGSSEGALIAKTTLDYYVKHDFAFNEIVQGIDLKIVAKDKNNIGNILIKGKAVLNEEETFVLSDLAYLDNFGIHIVGREKYSKIGVYNYLFDNQILNLNPKVRRGFSFIYQNKQYFVYEGKLTNRLNDEIIYLHYAKLKMDAKHQTKLDYQAVIDKINKAKPSKL